MPLPTPSLDDRSFQQIVDEAKRRIPQYTPEWTDHNVSDPGVTLIELFAWMTEMILYRMNQVPDRNYIRFLDLVGVRLLEAQPAEVDVTFRLSARPEQDRTIPAGTEVSTLRTDSLEAITFTVLESLTVVALNTQEQASRDKDIQPSLQYMLTSPDNVNFNDLQSILRAARGLLAPGEIDGIYGIEPSRPVFAEAPAVGNAFYLGFRPDKPLRNNTLVLRLDCDQAFGAGVDPRDPPYTWEYFEPANGEWTSLEVERDTTRALNTLGEIELHIPSTFTTAELNGRVAQWIRCRTTKRPDQDFYRVSPRIRAIAAYTIGGTVPAQHSRTLTNVWVGRSNGDPGQVFHVQTVPMLVRDPRLGEMLEVENDRGLWEPWTEVPDFGESGPNDPHYTCDSITGELRFGPTLREPSGNSRQYGRIPPKGSGIRFAAYRTGGGTIGNVGEKSIIVLNSSLPYIDSVTNRRTASGGTDPETLEHAKMRAPTVLRSRQRAVTREDFEVLALSATAGLARARCLQPQQLSDVRRLGIPPGMVKLLLIPQVEITDGLIPRERLALSPSIRQQVTQFLDERRLLTATVLVEEPEYYPVQVEAAIKVAPFYDPNQVRLVAMRRLYRFLNPLYGGPDGNGWPWGRPLNLGEIYARLQSVPGVEYVERATMNVVGIQPAQGQDFSTRIELPPDGQICSAEHRITAS